MRRLLVLAIFIGMAAAVARWAGSRRRRALDRQPPGSVPVTRMQGQPVTLSVRPEALTFLEVRDSPNRFPGHIINTTYLGPTVQYELRLGADLVVTVCEMNPWDIRLPSSNTSVRAMCSPYDLVMMRK